MTDLNKREGEDPGRDKEIARRLSAIFGGLRVIEPTAPGNDARDFVLLKPALPTSDPDRHAQIDLDTFIRNGRFFIEGIAALLKITKGTGRYFDTVTIPGAYDEDGGVLSRHNYCDNALIIPRDILRQTPLLESLEKLSFLGKYVATSTILFPGLRHGTSTIEVDWTPEDLARINALGERADLKALVEERRITALPPAPGPVIKR